MKRGNKSMLTLAAIMTTFGSFAGSANGFVILTVSKVGDAALISYVGESFNSSSCSLAVEVNSEAEAEKGLFYKIYRSHNTLLGHNGGDAVPSCCATFTNQALSSLELGQEEQYTWTQNYDANAESVTLAIVPEASSALLLELGISEESSVGEDTNEGEFSSERDRLLKARPENQQMNWKEQNQAFEQWWWF